MSAPRLAYEANDLPFVELRNRCQTNIEAFLALIHKKTFYGNPERLFLRLTILLNKADNECRRSPDGAFN
jgi:hypothetical protein